MKKATTYLAAFMGLVILTVTLSASAALPTPQPIYSSPKSIAALGDSITRAANACEAWQECPQASWATGTRTEVHSQAQRLKTLYKAPKNIKIFNNAHSYTKVNDIINQATLATTQKAEYITILSGANDLCTPTIEAMTSTQDFKNSVHESLRTLNQRLPLSKIFVASIPNILNLWQEGKDNPEARDAWAGGKICQSLLANPESMAQQDVNRRLQVEKRLTAYNKIWKQECETATNCYFDNNALYKAKFSLEEISHYDYFHPSLSGQRKISDLTWNYGLVSHLQILRGTSGSSSDKAPIIIPLTPQNGDVVSGANYLAEVAINSKIKVNRVYANTQIGGVDMKYDKKSKLWTLPLDTTKAPNGIQTTFNIVAVDAQGNTGVSPNITVIVDNSKNYNTFAEAGTQKETK